MATPLGPEIYGVYSRNPTYVLTVPPELILRITLLSWSATKTLPPASTATYCGKLNRASVPGPSLYPPPAQAPPLPASVLTNPSVIFRMRWFCMSATYTLPFKSTATPRGSLNCAAAPRPSASPATPLPASVLTEPPEVIFRMRWLLVSPTYTFPAESTATPCG